MKTLNKYRVEYEFKHSRMGFSNSITVYDVLDEAHATQKAISEISSAYGSKMVNRFVTKTPILLS